MKYYRSIDGWVVAPRLAWPDFLNNTAHAARFMNWAIKLLEDRGMQPSLALSGVVGTNVQTSLAGRQMNLGLLDLPAPKRCR